MEDRENIKVNGNPNEDLKEDVPKEDITDNSDENTQGTETADEAIVDEADIQADESVQTDECPASESAESDSTQKDKGKFFKKKKDKKDEKIEELNDKVIRQMAEFENFRKRTDKEKSQMFEIGAKSVVEKILPVVDNFERGLAGVGEDCEDPFAQGMQMIYKQLMTSLEEVGVKPITAVGEEFNPDFHNAVMHVEDENFGEGVIVEELQKGYMYRDTVVRHSMVKVAN